MEYRIDLTEGTYTLLKLTIDPGFHDLVQQAGKDKIPINNGAVLNIVQIIWAIMSSAAEADLGALFINAKTAVSMGTLLIELGHLQPRTLMQNDNATAHPLLTNIILPKELKVMDVRMCDCCLQGIQPYKCKGEGHQWIGNQVFRGLD